MTQNPRTAEPDQPLAGETPSSATGVHPRPARVWPTGLRWMARWFR